ncbi:MAG: penicillin-binding transpeptidase domain-containing protein [Bacteroidetes bacterium]|nr:penicillin-binding transpeptidase domain-containing protein [Bacteroidota bacterium]
MQETARNNSKDARRRVSYQSRVNFLRVVFSLLFIAIVVKLAIVQGVRGAYYHRVAQEQYESRVTLRADRGLIYDRNGNLIVSNTYGYSYAADPELLHSQEKARIAKKFSSVFGLPVSFFMDKLKTDSKFVWLARDISQDQASALQDFNVYGLIRLKDQQRLYPYGSAAGQVLGFINVDGKGASGVELEFDSLLAGKNGYEIMQVDGIGRKTPSIDYPKVNPTPGSNIQLTIDMNIQQIVEQELAAGVEKAKAESASAVFMNPYTGEILAMANYPSFDPSNYDKLPYNDSRDRAITDVYEPGSTFKVVTASAALEEGIESPNDMIFADNGGYSYYGTVIRDFEPAGWITFRRALELSSNVAFSKIGRKIGADKFYRYARDFGFGAPTGITLPGEVPGELQKPYEWSKVALPFMSFGYGVMVTTLQMAQAYAAIANGGVLMRPYIVEKITDANGKVLFQNSPMEIRRVVTPGVDQTLNGMFVDVVEHGTGREAQMKDVLVAGKTGTAQLLVDGKYSKKYYHASFVGYFPVPNPMIVGYIMVDSPLNGYTGGIVSAPIFKRIATRIYGIMQRKAVNMSNAGERLVYESRGGSLPSSTVGQEAESENQANTVVDPSGLIRVPDVTYLDRRSAIAILRGVGLTTSVSGGDHYIVQAEKPSAGAMVQKGSTVHLALTDARRIDRMPNFLGANVRKAATFFLSAGISFHVIGSGKIVRQVPGPGTPIDRKITVTINCEDKEFDISGLFR